MGRRRADPFDSRFGEGGMIAREIVGREKQKHTPAGLIADIFGLTIGRTDDEAAGAKLNLVEESSGDEEGDQKDDNGSVDALAKEFKGQRWDPDKSVWK